MEDSKREREREGEHNEFGTSLPVVLHNISPSCRMCTDMITVRAYQRIFQLDSSILPPFFSSYEQKVSCLIDGYHGK